jgi:hypothetical protein
MRVEMTTAVAALGQGKRGCGCGHQQQVPLFSRHWLALVLGTRVGITGIGLESLAALRAHEGGHRQHPSLPPVCPAPLIPPFDFYPSVTTVVLALAIITIAVASSPSVSTVYTQH